MDVAYALKCLNRPIRYAKTACDIGLWVPSTSDLSSKVSKRLAWVSGPLNAVALLVDGAAIHSAGLSPKVIKVLSVVKRGCEAARWAEWSGMVNEGTFSQDSIKSLSIFASLARSSIRLWKDFQAVPENRRLSSSIPKFLKASLLFYAYMADSQRVAFCVKIIAKGIGLVHTSYCFYQFSKKISYNPTKWDINSAQVCKVISSIAFTCIAFYIIEIKVDFDTLR